MDKTNKKYLFTAISVFIVTFVLSFLLVNNTKTTYSIEEGIYNNGFPKSTFTSNYDTTNTINYVKNAYGSDTTYNNYFNNFNLQSNYLDNNNTNPLYLLMKNLETPKGTESFELTTGGVTEVNDKALTYIINHGYNITNTTNTVFTKNTYGSVSDNKIKQYITQVAIWLYIYENKTNYTSTYCKNTGNGYDACDFIDGSKNLVPATTVRTIITNASNKSGYNYLKYITELVDKAKVYTGAETSTMNKFSSKLTYSFSKDSTKAYVNNITPSIATNNDNYMYYSVEITDPKSYGVYIADKDGNKITNTSKMTGSFSIVIPLKKDISSMDLRTVKIKVNAFFIVDDNKSYIVTKSSAAPLDGLSDNLVVRYGEDKYDRYSGVILGYAPYEVTNTELTLNNFTKISKVDVTNSKELPGATLVVKNKNDESKTWTWISTDQPHFMNLDNGEYSLCETIAPSGYQQKTTCIDFTVDGSKVNSVTMENEPVNVPNTAFSKNRIIIYIGILSILLGLGIVSYYVINNKKAVN